MKEVYRRGRSFDVTSCLFLNTSSLLERFLINNLALQHVVSPLPKEKYYDTENMANQASPFRLSMTSFFAYFIKNLIAANPFETKCGKIFE